MGGTMAQALYADDDIGVDIGRVRFENEPGLLKKYYMETKEALKYYFADEMGRYPYFDDLKISVEKLPTYWNWVVERGKIALRPVGKIFGMYNPATNSVVIDPTVIPEKDDPERQLLEDYGMQTPSMERVLGEELVHADQHNTGAMYRWIEKKGEEAREYIEGSAAYVSDRVFGETGIYEEYKDKFGGAKDYCGGCMKKAYNCLF